jgi:8-oxo-dGTP pyrophosphatase MutT (NUDIX family)
LQRTHIEPTFRIWRGARHNTCVIDDIRARLAAYAPNRLPTEDRPLAAVLIPIYRVRDEYHIVLTKRTERVEHHKGEISFPGGARDSVDADLVATALRESHEEIGLHPKHVEVIGRVDDFITVSRFHVTPYVGVIDFDASPYVWMPQEREVAEILEVPLPHLIDPSNLVRETRAFPDGRVSEMDAYSWREHLVWGATARMLKNFLEVAVRQAEPASRPPESQSRGDTR